MVFSLVALSPGCGNKTKSKTIPNATKLESKKKKKDPRSYFKFKKNGEVKTKSGKAEKTYNFPDIKVGFILVAPKIDILPVLSLEIHEFEKIPLYFDFGISTHLLYLSIGYNIIPIFEVGIFLWVGYNFIEWDKKYCGRRFYGINFGLGITVIKF
ncbi:MAG: hypothetical protein KAS32_10295 [Candidatus Peribacteraceae bacterium]|nr:hypothetical protein [Candidatus Peribacteraceae bacterium]